MDLVPSYDQIGVSPIPDWVNANPTAGIQGSILNVAVINALMHELVNAIIGAGLTQNSADFTQILQALRAQTASYFVDTGNVNAPTIAPSPAVAALLDGMCLRVQMKNAPTGASVFFVNSLEAPIVRVGGLALTGNEWKAGDTVGLIYSKTRGAWQIAGLTPNDITATLTASTILNITGQPPPGTGFTGSKATYSYQPQSASSDTLASSFQAPCDGTVTAYGITVGAPNSGLSNGCIITVNGNVVAGSADAAVGNLTSISTTTVNKGDTVLVTATVNNSQALANNTSHYMYFSFIPS